MKRRAYTVREVHELFGMHPEQARRLCRRGFWRAKKVGAEWFIRAADVDKTFDFTEGSAPSLSPEAEEALDRAMEHVG